MFHVQFTLSFNQEGSLKKLQLPARNRQNMQSGDWRRSKTLDTDLIDSTVGKFWNLQNLITKNFVLTNEGSDDGNFPK